MSQKKVDADALSMARSDCAAIGLLASTGAAEKVNLTIPEYTQRYGPKRTRVFELIRAKELEAIKDGRRTYITVESAERRQARLKNRAE